MLEESSITVPVLKSDPTRIRQILFNLLSNALKFTEEGSITVSVTQLVSDERNVTTRFEIRDTGIGIQSEKIDALFEKFTQADSSITRKYGGSGLGLAICKELVSAMGGEIGANSVEGVGTTFWFSITCAAGDPDAVQDMAGVSSTPLDQDIAKTVTLKILAAEDNSVNQVVIRSMLEKAGHSVDVVGNGREAIEALNAKPYDVVLMDIQMPEMDGLTATAAIRKLGGPPGKMQIIALTANAMKGDRETYLAGGMNDYVTKPIEPENLAAALSRQCGAKIATAPLSIVSTPQETASVDPDTTAALAQLLDDMDFED
ncbi:MAG: ATP-binding protein [Alphaproteobacteria bacterium]